MTSSFILGCFVGKRRLESALEQAKSRFPNLSFDVRWRPFQLNPNFPQGKGRDKMGYYYEKFGEANVKQMIPRMKATAAEHGINMNYGGTVGNTLDSHRLIWLAREVGGSELQDKVVESLFKAYFEDNKSIEEKEVIQECADEVGLGDKCREMLSDDSMGKAEVTKEKEDYGRAFDCSGVPMFIVDGKFVLNGAQEDTAFLRVFGRLK
jgi:predicted DsbA family dithiol-disulfide isomerase